MPFGAVLLGPRGTIISLCLSSWQDSLCGICTVPGWINAEAGCGLDTRPHGFPAQPQGSQEEIDSCTLLQRLSPIVMFLQIAEVPGSGCLHRCLEASLSLGTQPG